MCSCAGWWRRWPASFFFFFNDTATTEIYPLSLHDALPISNSALGGPLRPFSRSTLTAITLSPLRYTSSRPPRVHIGSDPLAGGALPRLTLGVGYDWGDTPTPPRPSGS